MPSDGLTAWIDGKSIKLDKPLVLETVVEPEYPAVAAIEGKTGIVVFYVSVDTLGHASKPDIVASDDSSFGDSVLRIADQLVFSHPLSNGRPVSFIAYLIASFDQQKDSSGAVAYHTTIVSRPILDATEIHVTDPVVLEKHAPQYPQEALQAGIEGRVWVKLWIDTNGKVGQVIILKSDNPIFNSSAIRAAKAFKFRPALYKDRPIGVFVSVPFKFKIK